MNLRPVFQAMAFLKCLLVCTGVLFVFGCGTTKWSDTSRTGTEQLLISNAIDQVVAKIDFSPMRSKKCFLDTTAIAQTTDRDYLATTIRQHLATAGAILAENESNADYIVEVRAGAVGTDRDDLLVGIPATTLPALPATSYSATTIPEIPIIKRTKQRGVAKIALFAYNKTTGQPVWLSGNSQGESSARNLWFAGTGPLTRGTIYHGTTFAGNPVPLRNDGDSHSMIGKAQVFPETIPAPASPAPVYPGLVPYPPRN